MSAEAQQQQSYPQQIEVTLTLKIEVPDQETREYYLNSATGQIQVSMIADTLDSFTPYGDEEILSINGLDNAAIQAALNAEASV